MVYLHRSAVNGLFLALKALFPPLCASPAWLIREARKLRRVTFYLTAYR